MYGTLIGGDEKKNCEQLSKQEQQRQARESFREMREEAGRQENLRKCDTGAYKYSELF